MNTNSGLFSIFAHIVTIGSVIYFAYAMIYKHIFSQKGAAWWEYLIIGISCYTTGQLMSIVYGYYIKQIGAIVFFSVMIAVVFIILKQSRLNTDQRETAKAFIIVSLLLMIAFAGLMIKNAYNDGKLFNKRQHQLEVKVKEVKKLKKSLEKKIVEVKQLRVEYGSAISDLRNEIIQEKNARGIVYYEEAIQNQRISYDLVLIQRKKAYISKLDEISIRLQQGVIELEFIQRQTEDDVRLVEVLKNEKVDQIISSINNVVTKYLPDAAKLEINIDPAEMQTPRQIWNEIVESDQ